MNLSVIPNLICVARVLLVAPVAAAILSRAYPLALALFAFAAVSDALDGYLARHYGWITPLGQVLDPAADKLLMVVVLVVLAARGFVPAWLCAAAVLRDVVIATGAIAYRRLRGHWGVGPTRASKLNTVLAIAYVTVVLAGLAHPAFVPSLLVVATGAALLVTTVATGIDYVVTYARRALAGA